MNKANEDLERSIQHETTDQLINALTVQLAARQYTGTDAQEFVDKYFELLPQVKECYKNHKKENPGKVLWG